MSGKQDRDLEMLALYALGVPIPALAKQYGVRASTVRNIATLSRVKRPAYSDRAKLARAARAQRIRHNIAQNPSIPLFPETQRPSDAERLLCTKPFGAAAGTRLGLD